MTAKEAADSLLKLLEILVSWPVILLIVVLFVRKQLPELITGLAKRITKAPGGFEFAVLEEKVQTLATEVERLREQVLFKPSAALTAQVKQQLANTISQYQDYLKNIGFPLEGGGVVIDIRDGNVPGIAHYVAGTMVINREYAKYPDIVLHEYTQHVLMTSLEAAKDLRSIPIYSAIQTALADYYPCSFSDDPYIGEGTPLVTSDRPYIRNLDNERRFGDATVDRHNEHDLGEIWGGAFWEIRRLIGQEAADRIVCLAWRALQPSDTKGDHGASFVRRLVEQARSIGLGKHTTQIEEVFDRRELKALKVRRN